MITRSEYMENSSELHEKYYSQFVTDYIIKRVVDAFGIDRLKSAYEKEKYFNEIPLNSWDILTGTLPSYVNAGLKNVGDYGTLANHVCILKAAARMAVFQAENKAE